MEQILTFCADDLWCGWHRISFMTSKKPWPVLITVPPRWSDSSKALKSPQRWSGCLLAGVNRYRIAGCVAHFLQNRWTKKKEKRPNLKKKTKKLCTKHNPVCKYNSTGRFSDLKICFYLLWVCYLLDIYSLKMLSLLMNRLIMSNPD